ncbi:conserved exported hypothetical protein [uncultured Paludibacter sp.]|uniref:Uncharacterized protein n=1 Tax=uncultured Paludibacter sp. TaxID=497635 RepID=A0A653AAY1_9BACT|nr:conserved exported hypothetical protein [uncultured Paludibacter sp.]
MAKLKMKRYPKKPKATAGVSVMENYLNRCKEVDKENARRKAENGKRDTLRKRIAGLKQKI